MNTNLTRIEAAQSYLERELKTYKLISRMRREPPAGRIDAGRYHFLYSFAEMSPSYRGLEKKFIAPKQWFYFKDDEGRTKPACNLGELIERLHTVDLTVLTFHFQRGDFTRWVENVLHNDTLARQLQSLNIKTLSGEVLRYTLLDILEWESIVAVCCKDTAFLHGLALAHWEWALEFDENNKNGDEDKLDLAVYHYRRAKYYWAHLLGRKGYWQWFSEQYYQDKKGTSEDIPEKLRQRIYKQLLEHYYLCCRNNFNSSNSEQLDWKLDKAIFHLKCLCNWNVLKDENCSGLFDKPLLNQEWDQAALEEIDKEVTEIATRWMSEWLKLANEKLDDPAADLPRGISKNFKGALEFTRPYLELVASHPQLFQRLLMFVLTQTNKWCYETAIAGDHGAALTIMDEAAPVIEKIELFLTKPEANTISRPEQKVLSTSYSLWAQLIIESDVERGQSYADAAADWDPGDRHAGELRDQMSKVGVRVRLDQAQEYLENKEFQKAIEVLHEIDLEKHPDSRKPVNSLLAVTHFQWSMHFSELANQETEDLMKKGIIRNIEKTAQMINAVRYLGEAREHIAEALKYEPKHPVLTENHKELTQEVKYRPYAIKTKIGIERFEEDDYDNALVALEGSIPKDFPGYDTVIQIRAGCFFRRAIQHANNERFDAALADMRQAQALVPDNEFVREQLAELEQIRIDFPHLKAMREAEALLEKERYQDALTTMKNIPGSFSGHERVQSLRAVSEFKIGIQYANARNLDQALEHLEQAAKYDPREQVIRQQINELREIKKRGGFEAIARHNGAVQKAQEVIGVLNAANSRNPLTPERGYQLLAKLEEAVNESGEDPQIVALRDQLRQALSGHSRY